MKDQRTTKERWTEGALVLLVWLGMALTQWSCAVTHTQDQAIQTAVGIAYGMGMASEIQAQLHRIALEDEVAQAALTLEDER
tara:strand:+ start:291 stop:536 length:246 start_codon:yes stop_codon:yes gene_type:complete